MRCFATARLLGVVFLFTLACALPAQTKLRETYRAGLDALKEKKSLQAIGHLEKAVKLAKDKDIAKVKEALAAAYAQLGSKQAEKDDLRSAVSSFQAASRLLPEHERILQSLGVLRFRQKRTHDARRHFQRVLKLNPNNVTALQLMGQMAADEDNVQVANRYLDKASKHAPQREDLKKAADKFGKEAKVEKGFLTSIKGHFRLQYQGGRSAGVERALGVVSGLLEQTHRELGKRLGVRLSNKTITVVLYTKDQYKRVSSAHAWAKAYYDGKLRIALDPRNASTDQDLRQSLRHELTHAFLNEAYGKLPSWLHEGYAQVVEGKSVLAVTGRFRDGLQMLPKKLFVGEFASSKQVSMVQRGYAQSLFAVGYLLKKGKRRQFQKLLNLIGRRGMDSDRALQSVYGFDVEGMLKAAAR